MFQVACSGCGKQVEIEDFLKAARQPCPHCGRFILGGTDQEAEPSSRPAWDPQQGQPSTSWFTWLLGDRESSLSAQLFGHRVVLQRDEVQMLPPVCMYCGEKTDAFVDHWFVNPNSSNWSRLFNTPDPWQSKQPDGRTYEPWVRIGVPLCSEHRYHFFQRNLAAYGGVAALFGGFIATASAGPVLSKPAGIGICALGAILFAASMWLQFRGIRASGFYDNHVELRGVSYRFVVALHAHRARKLNKQAF